MSAGLLTGGVAVGAPAPEATPVAQSTPAPEATVVPADSSQPLVRSSVIAADGASGGPVTGGTVATVTGVDLGGVASVSFGGNAGQVLSATESTVTLESPPATELSEGTVPVELFSAEGAPVEVLGAEAPGVAAASEGTEPVATTAAASNPAATTADPTTDSSAAAGNATPDPSADPTAAAPDAAAASVTPLVFNYVPDPHIAAQAEYVREHWNDYNTAEYGRIAGNDCVNFTSQSLVARGWTMDADWSFDADSRVYSTAWSSSTAFAAYLAAHPEKATALTDDERAAVKVGDVVQFDWDRSGDRDHTGIVTRVEHTGDGVEVYFAGHTLDTLDKSVDESITNTGATVSYWSIK